MRNLLLTMVLLLTTTIAFSQMYIGKSVDEMDGSILYAYSETIDEIGEGGDKKVRILLAMGLDLMPHTLAVISRGIDECIEKGELIILFKDGTRLTSVAWNKFNCEGNSYFDINKQMAAQLSSKPIDKIRITNSRSKDSFTFEVSKPSYFIEAYKLSNAGIYR